MSRSAIHKEAATDDESPTFIMRDVDGRERIIQLCLLIDPRLANTPFSGWDEQEAFERVLMFDDADYAYPPELPNFYWKEDKWHLTFR